MIPNIDEEILADFLVESGELLEQLGEQLIELEQNPQDADLLNAVFRSFHTIKGGAGFLGIDALVQVCHRAEDVFNVLRSGERVADARLMDVVLRVLDVVNDIFDVVRAGELPESVDPELLETLKALAVPGEESSGNTPAESVTPSTEREDNPHTVEETRGSVSDEEFFAELAVNGEPETSGESGDAISDDEFEALLDQLHGKGQHGGSPEQPAVTVEKPAGKKRAKKKAAKKKATKKASVKGAAVSPSAKPAGGSEEITDEEFEALLDQLHGTSGAPGTGSGQAEEVKDTAPGSSSTAEPLPSGARKKPAPKVAAARKSAPESTVRVDTARLDNIMNMVGELVLVRNRLANLKDSVEIEEVSQAIAGLDIVTSDLQVSVMKTRMQPVKKVFGRFPRVVRDLGRTLGKEVDLVLVGEDTDLDKNLVEALADPLVHLVRNAMDHGIELPEDRVRANKPRKGRITLSASQEGDHILLRIEDDGKGMDPDVLRTKAVEKGMMNQETAARLDDQACFNLIFDAGFSTKSEVSDVSGRGVGMDVVKTGIDKMGGTVAVNSAPGRGSCVTIKVPLTLAIMPTLMIRLGGQRFALPLASVLEILSFDTSSLNVVDGQQIIMVREKVLPLFSLHQRLCGCDVPEGDPVRQVVVVQNGNQRIGFVVDGLLGQEEVVIKPFGPMLQGLRGLSGATITSDGKIAIILDVPRLVAGYA